MPTTTRATACSTSGRPGASRTDYVTCRTENDQRAVQGISLHASQRAAHDVAQRALVLVREARQRLRRLLEPRGQTGAPLGAAPGDREHLHPAVVLGRAPLDEAAVLEAVDDPGDVRVVAAQRHGQLAHRLGVRPGVGAPGPYLRRANGAI